MRQVFLLLFLGFLPACSSAEAPPGEEIPAAQQTVQSETRGTAEVSIGDTYISVKYGRPELQGRDMLGRLQDGQVWRLGMDEATTFETSKDLAFGSTIIQAGRYSIWAKKVSSDEWRLIFNSEADIFGTEHNAENDIAEIVLAKTELEESVDKFTIEVASTSGTSGEILMTWDTAQLRATFSVN